MNQLSMFTTHQGAMTPQCGVENSPSASLRRTSSRPTPEHALIPPARRVIDLVAFAVCIGPVLLGAQVLAWRIRKRRRLLQRHIERIEARTQEDRGEEATSTPRSFAFPQSFVHAIGGIAARARFVTAAIACVMCVAIDLLAAIVRARLARRNGTGLPRMPLRHVSTLPSGAR